MTKHNKRWFPYRSVGGEKSTPFDWSGVTVGHWIVDGMPTTGKAGRVIYRCTSLCGVASVFRRETLAAGASKTCEACRSYSGVAPPAYRVLDEAVLLKFQALWGDIAMVDERNTLESRGSQRDWQAHGRPMVLQMVDATGLGREFGWKITTRGCHDRANSVAPPVVRIRGFADAQRRIELHVRPPGGEYVFDIDLTTGRTDVPFSEIKLKVQEACKIFDKPKSPETNGKPVPTPNAKEQPVKPEPTAAAPSSVVIGGVPLDSLQRMRSGLDTIIAVGTDLKALADLKAEAQRDVSEKEKVANPLMDRMNALARKSEDTRKQFDAAEKTCTDLAAQLKLANAKRDELTQTMQATAIELASATEEAKPHIEALTAARASLKEVERQEADRVKALGNADNVAAILAGLSKIGV